MSTTLQARIPEIADNVQPDCCNLHVANHMWVMSERVCGKPIKVRSGVVENTHIHISTKAGGVLKENAISVLECDGRAS